MEGLMAQYRQDPAGDDLYPHLGLGFIFRLARPGGHDRCAEVSGQHLVGGIEIRVSIACHADRTLQAIRHHQLRDAAEKLKGPLVAHHPILKLLGAGGFSKGVVGGPEHRDEDLGPIEDLTGMRIHDGHGLATVIDKEFFARDMGLAHRRLQHRCPLLIEPTEMVVAVVGTVIALGILLPQ